MSKQDLSYIKKQLLILILCITLGSISSFAKIQDLVYEWDSKNSFSIQDVKFSKIKKCRNHDIIAFSKQKSSLFFLKNMFGQLELANKYSSEFANDFTVSDDCSLLAMIVNNLIVLYSISSTNYNMVELIRLNNIQQIILDLRFSCDSKYLFLSNISGEIMVYMVDFENKNIGLMQIVYSMQSQQYLTGFSFRCFSSLSQYGIIATLDNKIRIVSLQQSYPFNEKIEINDIAYFSDENVLQQIKITNDGKYIIAINVLKGIRIGQLSQIIQVQSGQTPLQLKFSENSFWFQGIDIPQLTYLLISSNNNLLFVSARSLGIQIIDISQIENPILYQNLQINYVSFPLVKTFDDQFVYVLSSNFIQVINKKQILSDDAYPNLFNLHLIYKSFLDENQNKKQRCYITQNDSLYWGAYSEKGLHLFAIDSDFKQILTNKQTVMQQLPFSSINTLLFDTTKQYVFLPLANQVSILAVYDISNINQPKLVNSIPSNINYSIEEIVFNQQKTIIAASMGKQILIIDIADINNLSVITQLELQEYINQSCSGIMFAQNDSYILVSSRGQGLILIDAKNLEKLNVLSILITNGGEDIQSFTSTVNFAYFIDGFDGIKILDLTKLPSIAIVSKIQIKGWSNHVLPIGNDEFIIVSTVDQGMITLFDIRNKYKPIFISQLQFDLFNSYSTCLTSDQSTIFINSQKFVLTYSLTTKLKIHKQLFFLNQDANVSSNQLNESNQKIILQVGQKVKIKLSFIYPQYGLSIEKLLYYYQNNMIKIPEWIKFLNKEPSILINAVKEGLDIQSPSDPYLNVLIIQTQNTLNHNDFSSFGDITINKDQSANIYQLLQKYEIIDKNNSVNFTSMKIHFHEFKIEFLSSPNLSGIENKDKFLIFIKDILNKSKQYNPIYFYLKGSLKFELSNAQNIISSISETAKLRVVIDQNDGSFYIRNTQELSISYEKEKSIINLMGKISALNLALFQKQIIFIPSNRNSTQPVNFDEIQIYIEVNDSLNYPIYLTNSLRQLSFIKKIEPIEKSISIQEQFDAIFQDSYIKVDKYLIFSFKKETFIDPQGFSLTFQAKCEIDDAQEQPISSTGWLQFVYEEADMRVQGLVPESVFWSDIKVKIIATNGYEETSDFFVMKVRIISGLLLLKIFLQISSPIVSIITMYQYRSIPYNIYFKKKLNYQKETIETNKEYIKKIPILNYDYRIAKKIFKAYKKYIQDYYEVEIQKNNQILQEEKISQMKRASLDNKFKLPTQEAANDTTINNSNYQFYKLNNTHTTQNDIKKQIQIFKNLKIDVEVSQKRFIELEKSPPKQPEVNSNRKISSPSKKMKTLSSESEDDEEQDNQQQEGKKQEGALRRSTRQNTFLMNRQQNNLQKNKVYRIIQFITKKSDEEKEERTQFQDYIMNNFLNKKGCLLTKQLYKDILAKDITFKHKKKIYKITKYKEDMENSDSVLYYSLKSFFVRFLLQKDKKARAVYRFIKSKCIESQQYTERDWYKHLIEIRSTKQTDIHGQNIAFPKLLIRESVFQKLLNELTVSLNKSRVYNKENNYRINLYLVVEVLFADALGLLPKNIDSYEPVSGESLHYSQFKIKKVEALIQIKHSYCLRFRYFINWNYRAYGSSQNTLLPNWMNISQKKNSIIISGIPKNQDVEEIMIRIYDGYDFIAMQFNLEIVNSEEDRNQQIQLLQASNSQLLNNSYIKGKSEALKKRYFFENSLNLNLQCSIKNEEQTPQNQEIKVQSLKDQVNTSNLSNSKVDRQSSFENILQEEINEQITDSICQVNPIPQFTQIDKNVVDFQNQTKIKNYCLQGLQQQNQIENINQINC